MKRLTEKEEEIMRLFWAHGELYVRDILELMPEPRPHFNTVSTFVRLLEQKEFVGHRKTGVSYLYYPLVGEEEYSTSELRTVMERYFASSARNLVSALVREEKLTDSDIEDLINLVKSASKQ